HAVVGAAVLDKWNFTRSLIMSTLHHEDLIFSLEEENAEDLLRLTATVNLAGQVCKKLGIGQREPDDELDLLKTLGAKALELDEADVESALIEVEETFTQNRDYFVG
ncbi:MAG: HDOD domain-containing protein, partial [Thermodesulfobacteriota bacterium]|nr:HDOD domain-containing protein [Thermodesulfobacteriota bacterium]